MSDQRTPTLTIEDIITATGGRLVRGKPDRVCRGVSTDTRTLLPGNLFIALSGDRFDGHDFIPSAVDKGAASVVIQAGRERDVVSGGRELSVISVNDTVKALGDIAHWWRMRFTIPVIAVTGSAGKTTTKEMIASVLSQTKSVIKNRGNFNNLIGLPLTLLEMNDGHEAAVVEMGTNRPGEITRLTQIASPDVGVITNVGLAHLEGLKTLEGVSEEKGALFSVMNDDGTAVVNLDDDAVTKVARQWNGKTVTFALNADADVRGTALRKKGEKGIAFTLMVGTRTGAITMSVLGEHNIYNALAAAACSHACGIDYEHICRGLSAFRQVRGRMEVFRLRKGAFLVDDTYNANPSSVREALKTLRDLTGTGGSTLIFGDMLELGDQAEEIHEDIGMVIADTGITSLILRGRFSPAVAAGAAQKGFAEDRIYFIEEPGEIADHVARFLRGGEWILIKGSRGMRMEAVTAAILETCGETVAANEVAQ
jgi:UDP-N-acetylmuramoyl-tripeptide--D-alanyl-D-alanine ligase